MAMPTKPCMVMLHTGVDGGRYQEDGVRVCVRLSVLRETRERLLTSQTQSTQESASQRDGLYDNYTVG